MNKLEQYNIPYTEEAFTEQIIKGNTEIVRLFLEAGMPANTFYVQGYPAPLVAAEQGHVEICKLLLELAPQYSYQSLVQAAARGHLEIVKMIILLGKDNIFPEYKDMEQYKNILSVPLWEAVGGGNTEVVKFLVESGQDINFISPATEWQTPLVAAIEGNNGERDGIIDYLLEQEIDVNIAGREGKTAIFYAVENGDLNLVKRLVKAGANLDKLDNKNNTILKFARSKGNKEIVDFLLESRAKE